MEHGFAISPLLQSIVLEFSNSQPFERAMDLLHLALPAVNIGSSQSQRLMQYFGELDETEDILTSPGFDFEDAPSKNAGEETKPKVLYIEVDGGHIRTDDGFRETKVGRIFGSHQLKVISSDNEEVRLRRALDSSDYLAHLGSHIEFTTRFDALIKAHLLKNQNVQVVVISDGAEWIKNWIEKNYPDAIAILDFYHATEHLGKFATMVFASDTNRTAWFEARKQELLEGKIDKVIEAISLKKLGRRGSIIDEADKLITYYQKNSYRMQYDVYLNAGYSIGSGAIESAISTVVQQRCKLVGQRWTDRVTPVLNIRAIFKSGKRDKLRTLINQKMGHRNVA